MPKQRDLSITVHNNSSGSESEDSGIEDVLEMNGNEDYTLEESAPKESRSSPDPPCPSPSHNSLSWDVSTRREAASLVGSEICGMTKSCVVCYNAGSFKESAMAACIDALPRSIPYRPVQDRDIVLLQKLKDQISFLRKAVLIILGASGWKQDQVELLGRFYDEIIIVTWPGEKYDFSHLSFLKVLFWQEAMTKIPCKSNANHLLFTLGEIEILRHKWRASGLRTQDFTYHGIHISQRPPGKDLLLGLEAILGENLKKGESATMYSTVCDLLANVKPGFQELEWIIRKGKEERKRQTERQQDALKEPTQSRKGRHRAGVRITLRGRSDEREVISNSGKRKIPHPEPAVLATKTAKLSEDRASAYYREELCKARRKIEELERELDEQRVHNPMNHPYLHNPFFPPLSHSPPRRPFLDFQDCTPREREINRMRRRWRN